MPPKKTESAAGVAAQHAAPAAATGASTKARATPSHPPFQAMITDAILTLRDRNGSSRQSLKKFVRANNNITVGDKMFDSLFNKALKMGVEKGHFTQPKGASGGTKLAKKQAEPKKPAPKKDKEGATGKKPAKKAAPKEKKAAAPKGEKADKAEKKTTKKAAAPKKAAPKEKKAAAPKAEKADKSEKSESLTKTKTGRVAKAAKPAAAKKAAPKKATPKKAAAAATATTAAASAEKK